MNLPDFLRSSYRRSRPSVRRRFRRPALEQLEDRTMLATFAVNSSLDFWIDPDTGGRRYYVDNDPGNGSVGIDDHPGLITLRAAIQESNALAGKDTINIDFSVGVIQPGKKLEPIIDSVVITTVPASATRVVLDGSLAGVSGALDIFSNDSVVSRLVIQNFEEGGIGLWGGLRNTIQDNYIGTDVTGTSATGGNTAFGIGIDGSNHNIIGGIGPGQGNIISNNDGYGIHIRGAATHANIVQGNRIGTDTTGALDRGNTRDGIFIEGAFENTIGGIEIGAGNVISNSHAHGIHIQGAGAHGNIVQGNRIGTDMGGTANLGNFRHGVFIERASNNTIGGIDDGAGNVIAFNGRDLGINGHGVVVAVIPADPAPPSTPEVPATGNSIRRNSIFSNAGRGIDLGNDSFTVNGFGEDTTGPNHFQDYPVVTKVVDVGGGIREITWTLNTTAVAGRRYAIEFFANTEPDPSGFGEAEEYLLTREMITDVDGNATLDPPLRTARQYISATATDLTTSNTSEISMVDSDGDAIADRWERNKTGGFGTIDIDEDGTADFELQGADPTRKDIFVEIDAMVGMAPESSTLNKVEDAFRAAGINLVARLDEPNIANVYPFGASQHAWQEFDKLKYGDPLTRTAGHFGTPTERADTNHSNLLAAKALVYRYSIFAFALNGHTTPGGDTTSGLGEGSARSVYPVNDFMVTLGHWTAGPDLVRGTRDDVPPGGTEDQKAGTFMHELGHTLGLDHGGNEGLAPGGDGAWGTGDDIDYNWKPNYHSVMNYLWQYPGALRPDSEVYQKSWTLDYSHAEFDPLNEGSLLEQVGIGGVGRHALHYLPLLVDPAPRPVYPAIIGSIDWNRNRTIDPFPVPKDLNGDGVLTELRDHNDWSALQFYFLEADEYQFGQHGAADRGNMTFDTYQELNDIQGQISPTEVRDRHVFYNNSYFDTATAANSDFDDDTAIAPDKRALLPGAAATLANYTSYSRGINGIMVDIDWLAGTPTVDDFEFKVGNDDDPSDWSPAPNPTSITVRPGDGTAGSTRMTIIWTDNAIEKQWLQVTVKAAGLGLSEDDVFYFGNVVAETGDSTTDARVTTTDLLLARNNPRSQISSPAPVTFPYDFDRDGQCNATDVLLARNNQTSFFDALKLIDLQEEPFDLVVSDTSLTVPENGTAPFTVSLSTDPFRTITVTTARTGGDDDLSVASGATLTFDSANWNIPQPVTLAAAADLDIVDGTAQFTVSAGGATNRPVVSAAEVDDLQAVPFNLVVSDTSLTVPEDGTAPFTVSLSTNSFRTITVSTARTGGDDDLSVASGATLTFDGNTWNIPQPVTLAAAADVDTVDGTAQFTVSAGGATNQPVITAAEVDDDSSLRVTIITDEDDGDRSVDDLSLREALSLAGAIAGDDVVQFAGNLSGGTIFLDSALGHLVIDSNVEIEGPGSQNLTIDAGGSTVLFVEAGATAILSGLTLKGGILADGSVLFGDDVIFAEEAEEALDPAAAELAWLSDLDQPPTDQGPAPKDTAAAAVDRLLATYWP